MNFFPTLRSNFFGKQIIIIIVFHWPRNSAHKKKKYSTLYFADLLFQLNWSRHIQFGVGPVK